jgi:hypothetical protein
MREKEVSGRAKKLQLAHPRISEQAIRIVPSDRCFYTKAGVESTVIKQNKFETVRELMAHSALSRRSR